VKAPVAWLREFADLPDTARVEEIAERVAGVGFEVAGIDGDVIDFEITANRPDCLSIRGLAREAATVFGVQGSVGPGVQGSGSPGVHQGVQGPEIQVTLESPLCGRYALVLADVTVGPSPSWLVDRLTAAGVRPINNVVDVTNYVMLECGQPLHAFDLARLAGPEIRVRLARTGEPLTTLDGQSRMLDQSMLVIADRDRAVGVAGVMGGATSEVSSATTRVALESAWFQPVTVRATAKRLGLKTEASSRFERGADVGAVPASLARALDLLEAIGGGRRVGNLIDVYPAPAAPRVVTLTRTKLDRLLGDHVPDADVTRIAVALGFATTPTGSDWQMEVPSWRVDVSCEADLIEEIGRHWGVNRVPATFPALRTAPGRSHAGVLRTRRIRRLICGAGLQEAVTFTFIERAAAEWFVVDPATLVSIANPLSEKFAILRPSLLPGLLDALIYNRRRDIDDVRLFEAGAVFEATGEHQRAAWVLCGSRQTHWSQPAVEVDLFDALGVAGVLADAYHVTWRTEPDLQSPWYVPGRAAALMADDGTGPRHVGSAGQLRPEIAAARGLTAGVVVAGEIDVHALHDNTADGRRITALPRHPAVIRDLSVLIATGLPAAAVRGTIRANAPATLVAIREFDRYQGRGIPDGQVSLSLRLTFRDRDRTLTDAEVQHAVERIVDALIKTHHVTLRNH